MLFDLSGKHGIAPDLSYLDQQEDEPDPADVEKQAESFGPSGTNSFQVGEISTRLAAHKRMAIMRQLRIRTVPIVLAVIAAFSHIMIVVLESRTYSPSGVVSALLAAAAAFFVGFFGILPSDKRAVPLSAILYFVVLFLIFVGNLYSAVVLRQSIEDGTCTIEDEVAQCWFIEWFFAVRSFRAICLFVGLVRLVFALKVRTPSKTLLCMLSSWVGLYFVLVAISNIVSAIFGFLGGTSTQLAVALLVVGVGLFTLGSLISFHSRLRPILQSWLLSRSESTLVAAGVSELLGSSSIEDLLKSARATFKFVLADRITFSDMEVNKPDPGLAALTEKGRLGFVDAFVSHSWHDDPTLKWLALQNLREEFKANNSKEPRLWIDKYSIDQTRIESSLACLPIYLAGCSELWILCGRTYLERLWCIVEIFVFLEMGGLLSNIKVRLLENKPDANWERSELKIGKETSLSSQSEALAIQLANFDPRNARCFVESDSERLHGVIEITGYERISALVREIFK